MKFITFAALLLVGTFSLVSGLRMSGRLGANAQQLARQTENMETEMQTRLMSSANNRMLNSDESYEEESASIPHPSRQLHPHYPPRAASLSYLTEESVSEDEQGHPTPHYWGLDKVTKRPTTWPYTHSNATYWGLEKTKTRPVTWPKYLS